MAFFKRIFLFIAVNILIMVTISIVLNLLGIQPYLTASGIDYGSLLAFCLVWGMGGAFISLALSRVMAKWMMGVEVIDPDTRSSTERELLSIVYSLAKGAGLPKMPQVGIYNSPEVNAFATGPTKSRALVAVSAGLLQRMNKPEIEGVLGHEIAHIANGDMVTMTLIQGVVNAFAMFLARVVAYAVSMAMRGDNERDEGPSRLVYSLLVFLFDIIFTILGSMIVAYFSRIREFRADRGGAQFAGRDKMIQALEALQHSTELIDNRQPQLATLKISGKGRNFAALFSTHPPLEVRIERLKQYK